MRKKQFTVLHLLAVGILSAAAAALVLLLLRPGPDMAEKSLLDALALVRERFVAEYDETAVVDGALEGMVDALGDRWSHYLTQEEYQQLQKHRANRYVGVGITVSYEDERGLTILEVLPGGPAEEAGLRPGEVITAVDGVSIAGEARLEAAGLIQGEEGTQVVLTLLGSGGAEREASVRRAAIDEEPVEYELRRDGVGYVRLKNFYDHSAEKLNAAVDDLVEQGAAALVFDMRNNGGGYLTQLTDMLDHLLPEGPIFRSRNVTGKETVTESDAACVALPMAVLVNGSTYSAAEFFAAALQEQGAAIIVGEPTSGKGYSQQAFELPNGGAVNISTGAYSTGEGVSLIGTGLTLDAEVYLDEGTPEDEQLMAALALLRDGN